MSHPQTTVWSAAVQQELSCSARRHAIGALQGCSIKIIISPVSIDGSDATALHSTTCVDD